MQIKSNPARWQRLKEILADALEQTVNRRADGGAQRIVRG